MYIIDNNKLYKEEIKEPETIKVKIDWDAVFYARKNYLMNLFKNIGITPIEFPKKEGGN